MKLKIRKIAVASTLLILGATANAQLFGNSESKTYASAVDKAVATGEIVMGYRGSSAPLSFKAKNEPEGYAVDFSKAFVADLEKQSGKKIKIVWEEITPSTRIQLIDTGKVSVECSSTTNTAERRKQVNFSSTFYVAGVNPLYNKTVYPAGIRTISDMINQKAVVVSGSTGEKLIKNKISVDGLNIELISVKDNAEAVLMLEQGRANIWFQDDILMATSIAKSSKASDFVISKFSGQSDEYGCMSKLGDTATNLAINTSLAKWAKSGDMEKSYSKWFTSPIASMNGLNANYPMSPQTLGAITELKAK